MQQKLIDDYKNLMHKLMVLPGEIDEAQRKVTERRMEIADLESSLAVRDAVLIGQIDGKNAEQRKANLTLRQENDAAYQRMTHDIAELRGELAAMQDTLTHLERVYSAVCYQTRLHAAMLNYLGSAGAPVRHAELDFTPIRSNWGTTTANGSVTAEDAAQIGL